MFHNKRMLCCGPSIIAKVAGGRGWAFGGYCWFGSFLFVSASTLIKHKRVRGASRCSCLCLCVCMCCLVFGSDFKLVGNQGTLFVWRYLFHASMRVGVMFKVKLIMSSWDGGGGSVNNQTGRHHARVLMNKTKIVFPTKWNRN